VKGEGSVHGLGRADDRHEGKQGEETREAALSLAHALRYDCDVVHLGCLVPRMVYMNMRRCTPALD